MIINDESCANIVGAIFVRKLNSNTIKHKRSYRLQCLNKCDKVRVNKQVLTSFLVGKYKSEVLCVMVLIHSTHLLLGYF